MLQIIVEYTLHNYITEHNSYKHLDVKQAAFYFLPFRLECLQIKLPWKK